MQETILTLVLAHVFESLLLPAAIVSYNRNWTHFKNAIQFCKADFYRLLQSDLSVSYRLGIVYKKTDEWYNE